VENPRIVLGTGKDISWKKDEKVKKEAFSELLLFKNARILLVIAGKLS